MAVQQSSLEVFLRSLSLVGVAELFDKTWFMGLLLALRFGAPIAFAGSFSALFLHTILAAAMGLAFARFLSQEMLHYLTFAVMLIFAVLYAKDCYQADPDEDAIEAGKEEAEKDAAAEDGTNNLLSSAAAADLRGNLELEKQTAGAGLEAAAASASTEDSSQEELEKPAWGCERQQILAVGKSFMGVFIAEWGDRTQVAMIGQHASQPLVPVFLGSVVAFFFLTLSAVGAASLLKGLKIRSRVIFGFSACCFLVFAVFALRDALAAAAAAKDSAAAAAPEVAKAARRLLSR